MDGEGSAAFNPCRAWSPLHLDIPYFIGVRMFHPFGMPLLPPSTSQRVSPACHASGRCTVWGTSKQRLEALDHLRADPFIFQAQVVRKARFEKKTPDGRPTWRFHFIGFEGTISVPAAGPRRPPQSGSVRCKCRPAACRAAVHTADRAGLPHCAPGGR